MRNYIVLLILLLPVLAIGQTVKLKSDTIKSKDVINELQLTWNLGLNEDGEEPAEIRVFNKFKSLFWSQSIIYDDIDAYYDPDSIGDKNPYKTKQDYDSIQDYSHDVVLQFKNLKIDTANIQYHFDSLSYGIINVSLMKEITGTKRCEYVIEDIPGIVDELIKFKSEKYHIDEVKKDNVVNALYKLTASGNPSYQFHSKHLLEIRMVKKGDTIKISSIRNESTLIPLDCISDKDKDGVVDATDNCPDIPGDFTASGCKDRDLDGVPDSIDYCISIYGDPANQGCPLKYFTTRFEFSVAGGGQTNSAKLSMPELNQLGYESIDTSLSSKGSISDPGLIPSIALNTDLTYYFNKSKRIGIALGATLIAYNGAYNINKPAVYTFKSNDGNNDYRRRITLLDSSSEKIQYSIMNIPLLFKYRYRSPKLSYNNTIPNWYFEFSAGPSYLVFNTKTKPRAYINFEGIYQAQPDSIIYTDNFDPSSTWNIWLTGDSINRQSESPGVAKVFALLDSAGYDFAYNKKIDKTAANKSKSGIALNARFDVCYKFDDKGRLAFKFGASAIFATLTGQSKTYKLIDKTTDPYNSIYNGQSKLSYFSYGLHAGFIFQW